MSSDFWETRPSLVHVRDFARARRVPPTAMLASLIVRAIGSLDPNVVGPAVIGGHSSLNLAVALVGPSGFGKGATEAAAREATDLPVITELPLGTGEGLARTFAPNDEGQQEVRAALFSASEIDGLAAIGSRQGSTTMAVFRQAISGESIGGANAQRHTRVIVPAHSYRAVFTVGVQPERAAPLLGDTAGTAQRILWVPTTDPDAPTIRPTEPERLHVPRALVPSDRRTVITLPDIAVEAMERTQLAKLHGDPDVDPLDGHALLTRAKVAVGLMVLDGRSATWTVTVEDWDLAGSLMRESTRTRDRIAATLDELARRSNRAKAHAAAERDEYVADRKLDRAKDAVVRWLTRDGEMPTNKLRSRLKADVRDYLGPALADLVAAGIVVEVPVERGTRYRLAEVQGVPPVHPLFSQVKDGVPEVQGVPDAHEEHGTRGTGGTGGTGQKTPGQSAIREPMPPVPPMPGSTREAPVARIAVRCSVCGEPMMLPGDLEAGRHAACAEVMA
ncbi:hypothetical protein [Gordonia paraffinivorans]|uniref:hypothetical protein n=1 Tax=Gordonia paraffinivorans TaxID=175628 RepID=UPI001B355B97|nr:hypothetical protein [Gordonia paraffinivorans]